MQNIYIYAGKKLNKMGVGNEVWKEGGRNREREEMVNWVPGAYRNEKKPAR